MSHNYTLQYRTFDALMADVAGDFKKYQLQDLIDPQDLLKVVKTVNYDLGLRIHKPKEAVLEVEHNRCRLPNDFYVLDFALILGSYSIKQYLPQGTHTEERVIGAIPNYKETPPEVIDLCTDPVPIPPTPVPGTCPGAESPQTCAPANPCCNQENSCHLDCNGNVFQLVQTLNFQTFTYEEIYPLRILSSTEKLHELCPNLYWESVYTGVIRDGWLHTSTQTCKVYIAYQGNMEDEEGNLLVPDHDGLNPYYEYAIKQRILENLIMNDEEVNPNKLQLVEVRLRAARNFALSIVNTPNFQELRELYQANRNAMYSKYYDMFASTSRLKLR